MARILVAGVDTIVGANLAATLSEKHTVSTWAGQPGYEFPECDALDPADAPAEVISRCRPDWVLYCGPAARSCWEPNVLEHLTDDMVTAAQDWSVAAQAAGLKAVMISSDAVFTSPWMFHEETSHGQCPSFPAQAIRAAELQFAEASPTALIIRTNAYGWSPEGDDGWIETCLRQVQTKRIVDQDHIRHATPILATDLAEIVERACREELRGTFHVAGAERINPLRFVQRLANQFDLPWLAMRRESSLVEAPAGFGRGETSLQTKHIRRQLCVAMPLLSEGLTRLREQSESGYRDRIAQRRPAATTRRRAA